MTFFDIFSKNKTSEKPVQKLKIIVDNREKNSLVASELFKLGFEIEFQQLEVADYLVNNTALERKTISDLKSSIINKRIMQQLAELKQYEKHALILEGFNENSYEGIIHENAFRGFLLATLFDFKVPIIYTINEQDTARYISLLVRREPKAELSLRASKLVMSEEERLQFILEGFPQIGPVTARKLLEHFHTLKEIANAAEEELEQIIGKKSLNFCKLLHYNYKVN